MAAREDPAMLAPLYERYFPRIYAYCLRRVESEEVAEDLTSLIFTRALTGAAQFRGGSVAAWLFRIARNAIANHLRDRRPQRSLDAAPPGNEPQAPDEPLIDGLVRAEERERVARLLAALPDDQRELLTLRIAGELSAKEIGIVVGKSEGAVRVALHRIVRALRDAYRHADEGEV